MTTPKQNVRAILDSGAVLKALQKGSRQAVRLHKLLGNPVATWRDGKVVLIPPEQIEIDPPSTQG